MNRQASFASIETLLSSPLDDQSGTTYCSNTGIVNAFLSPSFPVNVESSLLFFPSFILYSK